MEPTHRAKSMRDEWGTRVRGNANKQIPYGDDRKKSEGGQITLMVMVRPPLPLLFVGDAWLGGIFTQRGGERVEMI